MRLSLLFTAIFARTPGSRAAPENLDQALTDFRHFELEQLDQELRRSARQEQLRAALLGAHVLQERLDPILGANRFARNHLIARDEAFGVAAQIDEHAVAIDALDDAGHQRADAALVFVDDLRTLGLAHLLHDDLLGGLRGDASESDGFHRHFDIAADFRVLRDVERVLEPQLAIGKFELGGIVREHFPASPRVVVAALAVDGDAHVDALAVTFARRGSQRCFERFENDFLVDALLVGHRVDHHQNLFIHRANSSIEPAGHSERLREPESSLHLRRQDAPCVYRRSAA